MTACRGLRTAGITFAISLLAPPALAQASAKQAGPGSHGSTLVGVVIDSVHGGGLAGATVLLDGTTHVATAESDGKFRIDNIPPGDYRIAVFHPLLDTLDLAIGTTPLRLGPDSVLRITLGTPSAGTLVARRCSPSSLRLGPGAVAGHVLHPDSDAPLAGVRVSIVWTELDISKENGLRRLPRMREASTDSSGRFMICGVPAGTSGMIQAERAGAETGEMEVDLADGLVAFQDLRLLPEVATDAAPLSGTAVLTGRVIDSIGASVADAEVEVVGARQTTRTNTEGAFRLTALPSGTRDVLVRRVGYSPARGAVTLSSAMPAHVTIRIAKEAPALEAVRVLGTANPGEEEALRKNGFLDRKRMGNGHYLSGDEITRHRPQYFSELFHTMPGFRVEPGVMGNAIRGTRSSNDCVTFWVDGIQYNESQSGDLDGQLQPEQVIAIETYSPSLAPSEFKALGRSSCSVVVVWTNRTIGS